MLFDERRRRQFLTSLVGVRGEQIGRDLGYGRIAETSCHVVEAFALIALGDLAGGEVREVEVNGGVGVDGVTRTVVEEGLPGEFSGGVEIGVHAASGFFAADELPMPAPELIAPVDAKPVSGAVQGHVEPPERGCSCRSGGSLARRLCAPGGA